jgi:hypothetical protein
MNTEEIKSGLNAATGRREDDEVTYATELLHTWTSAGKGCLLTPTEIATIVVKNRVGADRTFSPDDVRDQEYIVRGNLNKAWRYDSGKGRRTRLPLCLAVNDGIPSGDSEWIVPIKLDEGTISRNKIGRFGILRLVPNVVDHRGRLHTLEITTKSYVNVRTGEVNTAHYLNGSETTAHNIQGFVGGFSDPSDVDELFTELSEAVAKIKSLSAKPDTEPEVYELPDNFRDKPPADLGY